MIFSQQKGVLSVQVERLSRLARIHVCHNKTAEANNEALCQTIDTLPSYWFNSITYDNGSENVKHTELKECFDIETFFCDPYCSWQKGLVEHTNMLLRQYLPRKTNITALSEEQIYEIQEKINNRHRKCLNWLSPNEYAAIIEKKGQFTPQNTSKKYNLNLSTPSGLFKP